MHIGPDLRRRCAAALHVGALSLLTGCTTAASPSPDLKASHSAAAEPEGAATELKAPDGATSPKQADAEPPSPYSCTTDASCRTSCSQGAVNRSWYARMFPGGEACEDGCTHRGSEPARCEDGRCVAYRNGARDPLCTAREELVDTPQVPGPAHRCTSSDECTLSCTYGALRRDWYERENYAAGECRDGCNSAGMDVACIEGICTASLMGEPAPECTMRPLASP